MTSFIVDAHTRRTVPSSWKSDDSCIFCRIIEHAAPAYRLYEDDTVVAFLDILPLRPGHTLLVPKTHYARVSELPVDYAAALGAAVSKISLALTKAVDNTALNVVCNQEYAQAVPHVHYHIIPAPNLNSHTTALPAATDSKAHKSPVSIAEMHHREFEARGELDDDEAIDLVKKVKAHL